MSLLIGCKKQPVQASLDYIYYGTVSGVVFNGKPWPAQSDWIISSPGLIGPASAQCKGGLGYISIYSKTKENYDREDLGISGLPLRTGKIILTDTTLFNRCPSEPGALLYLSASEGDVLIGKYNLLLSVENSVTITYYNTSTGDVEGTFDISLVKDFLSPGYYTNYTDTVRFSGGTFKTKWLK